MKCTCMLPVHFPYHKGKEICSNLVIVEDVVVKCQDRFPMSTVVICRDVSTRIDCRDTYLEEEQHHDEIDDPVLTIRQCLIVDSRLVEFCKISQ